MKLDELSMEECENLVGIALKEKYYRKALSICEYCMNRWPGSFHDKTYVYNIRELLSTYVLDVPSFGRAIKHLIRVFMQGVFENIILEVCAGISLGLTGRFGKHSFLLFSGMKLIDQVLIYFLVAVVWCGTINIIGESERL